MQELEVEVSFRNGVEEILTKNGRAQGVVCSRGQIISSPLILSCAGYPETIALVKSENDYALKNFKTPTTGKMSFTEVILMTDKKAPELGQKDHTIIFENKRNQYLYRRPTELFDDKSAVICLPNNFAVDDYDEGVLRVTMMANYHKWRELKLSSKEDYLTQKKRVLKVSIDILKMHLPHFTENSISFSDVFTPTTVERYTGHFGGCVYGTPDKSRDGKTPIEGLILIGTDQGFLGIIGSMLSGISMANLYGLMGASSSQSASPNTKTTETSTVNP
jgi:phytoene dehydrogenase-like protein